MIRPIPRWLDRLVRGAAAEALIRLFLADGPFARFPGPAAVVDGAGRVLAANAKAKDILAEARCGETKLGFALTEALREGTAGVAAVVVPDTRATVSVTILPLGGAVVGSSTDPASRATSAAKDARRIVMKSP